MVASCSPKLHTFTFREVARRAGLNPYEYTQVNIREQCSWTHTDDPEGATEKAIRLVRAGIARTRLSEPLEPLVVETTSRVLVIGGGVAGLRAAAGLADIGLSVVLVEREPELGGLVGRLGPMFPDETDGRRLVDRLKRAVAHRDVTVFTNAELVEKSGVYGNYRATIRVQGERAETIEVEVGSIVVTTGADAYLPEIGELGYGIDGVLTLPEFRALLDEGDGPLVHAGRPVESIAYVYCVGSRTPEHPACSRYCCTAAVHASLLASGRGGAIRQYHLYRDLRTYGKNELLATRSRREGSLYLRFPDDEPPEVVRSDDGRLAVSLRDLLTGGERLSIAADLVVLVTGLVPRRNDELVSVLKLPVGADGFFNEIHPKLRPVETVVDGVLIAGACQGPKTSSESVASALAAVTQSAAVLKQGFASLDPQVARHRRRPVHRLRCLQRVVPVRGDRADRGRRQRCRGRPARELQGLRWLCSGLPRGRDRPARATPTHRSGRRSMRSRWRWSHDPRRPRGGARRAARARPDPGRGRPRAADGPRARRRTRPSQRRGARLGDGHAQVRAPRRARRHRGGLLPIRGGGLMEALDPRLLPEVASAGFFDAAVCMNCGVCTATCPLAIDLLPRRLFRVVLLGMRDHLEEEREAVFSCLLCRACEESCPAGVHIAENVRTLRHYLNHDLLEH